MSRCSELRDRVGSLVAVVAVVAVLASSSIAAQEPVPAGGRVAAGYEALLLEPTMLHGLYQWPELRAWVRDDGLIPMLRVP